MCALWQPEAFAGVNEDSWEDELAEDEALVRHIEAGTFVPLNVGGDGAFQAIIRIGTDLVPLTEAEIEYRLVSSSPYLLESRGTVAVGGLEDIGGDAGADPLRIGLEPGRYRVIVHLVDWAADPNSAGPDGEPLPDALPDFVIQIAEEAPGLQDYRRNVETFERP
ncbi:hypothetical protein [Longispora albida]|uniref:hypothetical protein n=1 Tax=Longispora albida TaxID=203523 RepID=UPI00037BA11A|nr:hypothetical protein [Longispora albida]